MDVTTDNFKELYPSIINKIRSCAFVSFDHEFTGIRSDKHLQNSLFDTLDDRYRKLKACCEQTAITQFGISIFSFDRDKYIYSAESYTFHLRPQSFADIDQSYLLQASSIDFMIQNKFDFNKFLYKGIFYMSRHEISNTIKRYAEKTLYDDINMNINKDEYDIIQMRIVETILWYKENSKNDLALEVNTPVQRYIIQKELQNKFSDLSTTSRENKMMKHLASTCKTPFLSLWSTKTGNKRTERLLVAYKTNKYDIILYTWNYIIVKKKSKKNSLDEDSDEKLFNYLLEELSGVAVIFEALVKSGKPIVGHNILYDLALTYAQFVGPLPKLYETFKREIHKLLPCVYDTKHISHKLQSHFKISKKDPWDFNSLENVYTYFNGSHGRYAALFSPQIKISNHGESGRFHEAGWDAYCAGYIFVRLAHWQACEKRGTSQILSVSDHLLALRPYSNAINLIRASRPFIYLDKADPPVHRPNFLYLRTSDGSKIDSNHVAQLLTRFGSMDIKKVNSSTLVIAIAGYNSSKSVTEFLKKEKAYTLSKFGTVNWTKLTVWTLGVAALGSFAYYYLKK